MNEAIIGFLGVIVGCALTGIVEVYIKWRERVNKQKSLARSFKADMNTIMHLLNFRKYAEEFKKCIQEKKVMQFAVTENYLELYEKQVTEIGILPYTMVENVVQFYTFAKSALEDFKTYCSPDSPSDSYLAYTELGVILKQMQKISDEFSHKVDAL